MTDDFHLALAPGVTGVITAGSFVLQGPGKPHRIKDMSTGLAIAMASLLAGGGTRQTLARIVHEADGVTGLTRFHYCTGQFLKQGLITESVCRDGRPLVTLLALSSYFAPVEAGRGERLRLSRFCFLRRHDDQLVLEQPLGHARLLLHDPVALALIHALAEPRTRADVYGCVPALDAATCEALLALLERAGAVAPVTAAGDAMCDDSAALRTWEFHDLLFHTRSRIGRHDAAVGASFRRAGAQPAPPAFKAPQVGVMIDLAVPDMARATIDDPPFAAVQEGRRSIRRYGQPAISAAQLGDFLYRVASVRDVLRGNFDTPDGPLPGDFSVRPYPSGGSLYELDIYPAIANAADLPGGLTYYDPRAHSLLRLAAEPPLVQSLLAGAAGRAGIAPDAVQVVLHITARFDRVAWKYESMAYALVLKHVGVLFETMYLVASALKLAPCAIGSGDSDLFAAVSGIDYFAEGLVGEFLLGTCPSA